MAWTQQALDNFAGSFNDDLNTHTPDQGSAWVTRICAWAIGLSNHTGPSNSDATYGGVAENTTTLAPKQAVEVVLGSGNVGACACRFTWLGSNQFTGYRIQIYIGTIYYIRDNGASSLNVLSSEAYTGGAGSTIRIEADDVAQTVKFYVDASLRYTATSETAYTTGKTAMYLYPGSDQQGFNTFKAEDEAVVVGGQPTTKRWGGIPHMGTQKLKGGVRGGPWGRSKSSIIIPRWLAEQERQAA